jgi:hypothetical protein
MTDSFGVIMSAEQVQAKAASAIVPALPLPPCRLQNVTVRDAVPGADGDLAFIDSLQKMHSHMVGFFPKQQMENYIAGGHVIIAMDEQKTPLGYCVAKDQYLKRDDVGIVYQLNVLPLRQRNLIGATLVKAAFERAAYGCKLFCCWCAQDIQANWFWESIGFLPLAFRTGSRSKQRTHIFWQKRIREGDEVTPYWFPSQTQAGAVGEDRIVLPIPPGTHWRDAKPLVLPGMSVEPKQELPKTLPGGAPVRTRPESASGMTKARVAAIARSKSKHLQGTPAGKVAVVSAGGLRYIERADAPPPEEINPPKPKRPKKPRQKNDPKFIKAARELRDRFLEEVNSGRCLPAGNGKYAVSRQIHAAPSQLNQTPLLDAA